MYKQVKEHIISIGGDSTTGRNYYLQKGKGLSSLLLLFLLSPLPVITDSWFGEEGLHEGVEEFHHLLQWGTLNVRVMKLNLSSFQKIFIEFYMPDNELHVKDIKMSLKKIMS